eukprot:12922056-Ditylum_brightwellii.AAC.1
MFIEEVGNLSWEVIASSYKSLSICIMSMASKRMLSGAIVELPAEAECSGLLHNIQIVITIKIYWNKWDNHNCPHK